MPTVDSSNYHFAVGGKSWGALRQYFPDVIPKVVVKGTVFARMSPDQKGQLVESLQDLGYYVGMCGDGANDCGALKTAHAGISLSEAEASVASPFTSKTPNISCVPTVIREGRAALVTSFGIFKYMACYSLTQFITVLLLYWQGANITDFEFLYIDLLLLTTLSVTFGRTAAYHKLSKQPPLISLTSVAPILSLVLQMAVMLAVQIFWYFFIQQASWFEPYVDNPDDDYQSHINTALFYCSSYQYIILALVLSKGKPYRKTIYTNFWFLGNILACIALTVWINVYPIEGLSDFLELKPPPDVPYRLLFLASAAVNLILCLFLEMFILDSKLISVTCQQKVDNCLPHSIPEKSKKLSRYEVVTKEIATNSRWPPAHFDAGGLSGLFHRLDSAFQSFSEPGGREGDTDSLIDSGSEVESLSETSKHLDLGYSEVATKSHGATPGDISLSVDKKHEHTNVTFNLDDETKSNMEGRINIKF